MTTDWSYLGTGYARRPTREVRAGDVGIGGDNPIRVQSMTTPATRDTRATVAQIERLVDAGCEIVRVTVPTTADADSLPDIRRELERRRIRVPLVADIHFTPAAAMRAVEHVEKIRINPGNYADKKKFAIREYTGAEYDLELERIADVFSPLVRRAKELGVSMRIGTNHGSLSDRIMNRYGDTPEGMVESALEFVRICESHGYRDLVLSMKASNPVVVLHGYRLLAVRMAACNMDYPFHLGVTEAGDGEDARIKSAIGIGGLLDEGLGDTVRVSLTEDPVAEVPVALDLVAPYNRRAVAASPDVSPIVTESRNPFAYTRRVAASVQAGPARFGEGTALVEVPLGVPLSESGGRAVREELDRHVGTRVPEDTRADLVSVRLEHADELESLEKLRTAMELVAPRVALSAVVDPEWLLAADDETLRRWIAAAHRLHVPILRFPDEARVRILSRLIEDTALVGHAVLFELGDVETPVAETARIGVELARLDTGIPGRSVLLALRPRPGVSPLHDYRVLVAELERAELDPPLVLLDRPSDRDADSLLGPSCALGGVLCDGRGESVHIDGVPPIESRRLSFGILQAARVRITRTEFISCPSCGRTLFDLEETTARIKARTSHLKGLKIAVMGCIVNGPGEMADADFGYVGWGENKIALFVGRDLVAKDIPTATADERLVELIKENGRWVEPPVTLAD